jgi:hypothetical protein
MVGANPRKGTVQTSVQTWSRSDNPEPGGIDLSSSDAFSGHESRLDATVIPAVFTRCSADRCIRAALRYLLSESCSDAHRGNIVQPRSSVFELINREQLCVVLHSHPVKYQMP